MIYLLGYPRNLSYDYDWIQAFVDHYGDTRLVHLGRPQDTMMQDAKLIVLLHSVTAQGVKIPQWVFQVARKRKCPLLMLSGNDYKHFEDKQKAADELCVDLIGTLAPNTPYRTGQGLRRVAHVPHALNPKAFRPDVDYDDRPIVIGYRGYKYPETLGDNERNALVESFMFDEDSDVRWGVFDHPRQYADWLRSCKATIASEAGMKGMKAISSRQFDAIGSGTALVMFEGEYSGCIDDRHYIKLAADMSNKAECVERVKDRAEWESVTCRALHHVVNNHTYTHRMAQLDDLIWQ